MEYTVAVVTFCTTKEAISDTVIGASINLI